MKNRIAAVWMLATSSVYANFADCILDKAPGTANAAAASAVLRSCSSDYPNQYYEIEKGSGRGLFGFKDQDACIIKKSRDTAQHNAAIIIANACRCLYGEPAYNGEMCGKRPVPWVSYQPPVADPTPVAPTAKPAPPAYIAPPPTVVRRPSQAEIREAKEKMAYDRQVKADLQFIFDKAISDYPYLNTPAGQRVVDKIVKKRDELIAQGVYPSIALTRAVSDFAPANAPQPVKEKAVDPVPVAPSFDKGMHSGFPPGCRWITPQEWSCK
jgi:hypothetical protein